MTFFLFAIASIIQTEGCFFPLIIISDIIGVTGFTFNVIISSIWFAVRAKQCITEYIFKC